MLKRPILAYDTIYMETWNFQQNDQSFVDDMVKCIFFNENIEKLTGSSDRVARNSPWPITRTNVHTVQ